MLKKGIKKSGILLVTSVFLLLAAGTTGETALADELKCQELMSQFGQWKTIDARGEDGAEFTYIIEFYPDGNGTGGDLIFGYTDEGETDVHYWSGSYYSAGPADISYGIEYEDCWLYNYYLDTPDGERQGEFAVEINGEMLTIMEMGGDAFWPFTSRLAEILEFDPVEMLDGDGELAGAYGYVHGDFLAPYEEDIYEIDEYLQPASTMPVIMTYNEIFSSGNEVLNYKNGEISVLAARSYGNGEILRIGGFNNEEAQWGFVSSVPYDTELQMTDVFVAGTSQDPRIVIFNAEAGMMMVDALYGEIIWEKGREEIPVGGSLAYDVAEDGTIYCAGYYDLGPTAIAPDGEILWSAQPEDVNIYWPYQIDIKEEYILVEYAVGNEEGNIIVAFDFDGMQQWVNIKSY